MNDEEQVRSAEATRYAAMLDGDTSKLATLLDEDLIYTHSDGSTDTLASYLNKVTAKHFVYIRIEAPINRLVMFGDTAVVSGQMLAEVVVAGETRQLANACLAVYRRRGKEWRLLAYQPTPLKRT